MKIQNFETHIVKTLSSNFDRRHSIFIVFETTYAIRVFGNINTASFDEGPYAIRWRMRFPII